MKRCTTTTNPSKKKENRTMDHPPPDASPGCFLAARVKQIRMRIEGLREDENRLADVDTADAAWSSSGLRWTIRQARQELYEAECAAHEAGSLDKVTAPSPTQLDEESARGKRTVNEWRRLSPAQRRRFHGRTIGEVRNDPTFIQFTRSTTTPRPLARRRGAGRPRAQAARSSARSGDSPDDPDAEHAPAVLRVRRPSGRTAVFEADGLEVDGPLVWATGRWRRRVGLYDSEVRYSPPGVYGFSAGEIVEVRA
jgi:hypothetical protein